MRLAHLNLKPVVAASAPAAALAAALAAAAAAQTGTQGAPQPEPQARAEARAKAGEEARAASGADEAALLERLARTEDAAEARQLERQLQAIWSRSGSPTLDLLLDRGREALEAGDAQAAIEHLTALTDHAPGFAEAWHLRASAFFRAGLYGAAVADLGRALTLNPDNFNALFGLASILETIGDAEGAYAAYARVKAMNPGHEGLSEALERLEPLVRGRAL